MNSHRRVRAFTLAELVLTLVLLGVLAAAAASLFSRPDAMALRTARDQLLAVALLAHKQALAQSGGSDSVTLHIEQSSADWQYRIVRGTVVLAVQSTTRAGGVLSVNGAALADGQTLTRVFTSAGATGSNLDLQFSAGQSYPLCLAASGFAYANPCQP